MSDRKQALKDLLGKVEAGGIEGTRPFSFAFGLQPDNRHLMAWSAYNGSLDAAKALHEAVLPDHDWLVSNEGKHAGEGNGPIAAVSRVNENCEMIGGNAVDPARAWLIAILKALIEQEVPQ